MPKYPYAYYIYFSTIPLQIAKIWYQGDIYECLLEIRANNKQIKVLITAKTRHTSFLVYHELHNGTTRERKVTRMRIK